MIRVKKVSFYTVYFIFSICLAWCNIHAYIHFDIHFESHICIQILSIENPICSNIHFITVPHYVYHYMYDILSVTGTMISFETIFVLQKFWIYVDLKMMDNGGCVCVFYHTIKPKYQRTT